jgi:hypothetical protein
VTHRWPASKTPAGAAPPPAMTARRPNATVLTQNEQAAGINAAYEQHNGFHDAENHLYRASARWLPAGPSHRTAV